MSTDTKGLIFLDSDNMIIRETLQSILGEENKREPVDIRAADFDDTDYHILVTPEEKNMVQISIQMRSIKTLLPMGSKASIDAMYGKTLQNTPESQFDLTFKFDADKPPFPKEQMIKNFAELRKNVLGAPIKRAFESLAANTQSNLKPMLIPFRQKEFILIHPGTERIMVFFSIVFEDETDRAIATIFLQEFVDAQRRVNGAPNCVFLKDPPQELEKAAGFKAAKNTVGYISFQIFKAHVEGKRLDAAVNLFVGFRAYLHYHIKASKAHLHTRMRMRVESLLKVLNRANPNAEAAEKATGMKNTTGPATKAFRKF